MALQRLYLPPTQSQNPNMLLVSIPNSETAFELVDSAAKCLAMDDSSPLNAFNTQALAVPALVIVSCVVKVLEAIKNNVVSGSHCFKISVM